MHSLATINTNDIHDLKKQVAAQAATIHQLRHIIAKMPGYVYWKDSDSIYQGCNERLAQLSDLNEPDDIIGKRDHDFAWGREHADQFVKDDQTVMQTGQGSVSEYELPQKRIDGQAFTCVRKNSVL